MKKITLLFILCCNFLFAQESKMEELFKTLNEGQIITFTEIFKNKEAKSPKEYAIYLDSITKKIDKTSNLYKVIFPFYVMSYEENNDYEKAIDGYNQLIKFFPDEEYNYLVRLSLLYKYVDNFDKSIETLKRQIELNSAEPIAYTNLANTYISLLKFDEAFEVLKSNKNDYKLDDDFKHYAAIYFYRNDFKKAKIEIDKYLLSEFGKEEYKGFLLAAKIYLKLNLKEQSCDFIKEADKLCPNSEDLEKEKKTILISNVIKDRNEIDLILKNCK